MFDALNHNDMQQTASLLRQLPASSAHWKTHPMSLRI